MIFKQLIRVTDYQGNILHYPNDRKGKVGKQKHLPVQNKVYNKTNDTKLKGQKCFSKPKRFSDYERMQQILQQRNQ